MGHRSPEGGNAALGRLAPQRERPDRTYAAWGSHWSEARRLGGWVKKPNASPKEIRVVKGYKKGFTLKERAIS